MKISKCCAGILLAAAFTMVIETSCSQSPPPHTKAEPSERVITKIHMRDNTLYVTSRYAVTDSFLVIQELLRDDKYYNNPDEPHVYGKVEPMKRPAADVVLPLRIPVREVESIGPWTESREGRNGTVVLVVLGVVVAGALVAVLTNAFDDN